MSNADWKLSKEIRGKTGSTIVTSEFTTLHNLYTNFSMKIIALLNLTRNGSGTFISLSFFDKDEGFLGETNNANYSFSHIYGILNSLFVRRVRVEITNSGNPSQNTTITYLVKGVEGTNV